MRRVLTNNLTAALDRRAMEGSIPALTFWLSQNPESPFYRQPTTAGTPTAWPTTSNEYPEPLPEDCGPTTLSRSRWCNTYSLDQYPPIL